MFVEVGGAKSIRPGLVRIRRNRLIFRCTIWMVWCVERDSSIGHTDHILLVTFFGQITRPIRRDVDPVLVERGAKGGENVKMPDLPLALLLAEVDPITAP